MVAVVEDAVHEWLEGDAELAAIIEDRIYPVRDVPSDVDAPWVTYQRIGVDHNTVLSGANPLADALLQIKSVSKNPIEAREIGELVRLRMLDRAFETVTAGIEVKGVRIGSDVDLPDLPTSGKEIGMSASSLDFRIFYKEPIPA